MAQDKTSLSLRNKQSITYRAATSLTYSQVGDNYGTKDPIKKLAQTAAAQTAKNLAAINYKEISDSRGESAFVWQVDEKTFMASVIEGLGTKNLVADEMRTITKKTYYDIIAHDTVATIINDLITSGAKPFVLHAYWAIEDNSWLQDEERMKDLIQGWKNACNESGVAWGGGETPTLKGIIKEGTVDLAGSAIGTIKNGRLIKAGNLQKGDRIIFLKSNGINANGVSLARAVAKELPDGYATKLPSGQLYGEALLSKTNIYVKLIQSLLDQWVNIHYISNITGHGLRKVMRAPQDFVYVIEKVYPAPELFAFIQKHSNLSDEEMYGTYNMGQDYAIFLPTEDVEKAQEIIKENGFESLDAGYLEEGKRQVVIKSKNITFGGETLDLR
ncbi:AIR synthase related protein [Patescibacteria group bacterium]|nr:AIR synthase related protein [Patescibacteria group bacterium]MCL5785005.1 AIR synthase related protein [Patescibacteria group bacterium]